MNNLRSTQTAPGVGLQTFSSTIAGLWSCMRPSQWVKNGFVLSALLFSGNLFHPVLALHALIAVAAFSAAASGVYLWNDSVDWRQDLAHPEKSKRPIPSGMLSPATARLWGLILIATALLSSFLVLKPACGWILSAYVLMNVAYTFGLKHVAILDIMFIAVGFVLRVILGAAAINVTSSQWLLMCTFLLALFLGIAKRRQELVTMGGDHANHRRVLSDYDLSWLDQAASIVAGATIVAYALYTMAPETKARFGSENLIFTLPFVVYGILRYLYIMQKTSEAGNPTKALLFDRHLLGCVLGWIAACGSIIYL